jgi:hypothetical protein
MGGGLINGLRMGHAGYAEQGASYLVATSPREEHEYWRRYQYTGAAVAMPEAVVKGELRPLRRRVCSWFNNRALPPHSSVWSGVALLPGKQGRIGRPHLGCLLLHVYRQ